LTTFSAAERAAFVLALTAFVTLVVAALTCARATLVWSAAFFVEPVAFARIALVTLVAADFTWVFAVFV
jgi:hypothetical protein